MKQRLFLAFAALLGAFSYVQAQTSADTYAKTIQAEKLKQHVYALASDTCAGRTIGTPGIEKARNYIVDHWAKTAVLKPYFPNTWLQPFPLVTSGPKTVRLQAGTTVLTEFKDYMYTGNYDGYKKELPIVFAGYGKKEDFEPLDVKGKAVLTLNNNLRAVLKNAQTAFEQGAELTLVANPDNADQFSNLANQLNNFQKFKRYRSPNDSVLQRLNISWPEYRYVTLNEKAVKQFTNRNLSHWKNARSNSTDPIGTVSISIDPIATDTIYENNVVACIPGTHPNESIVIGAHYDHLGVIDDKTFYGADDNASGVAALLELSSLFSKAYAEGYKPQKNLIFVAFSAEERGLWGSNYFAKHLENKDQIKLMINIDMIGRPDSDHSVLPYYFYFISKNLNDTLRAQNQELCKKYKLTPDYTSTIDASDHKSFSDIGVPVIFYFDGINQDLHKPKDTPNKLNYKRMERITRMIFETIWRNAVVSKT